MKKVFFHGGLLLILLGLSIICVDTVSAAIKSYCDDLDKSSAIVREVNDDYDSFMESAKSVREDIIDVSKSFDFYLNQFSKQNVVLLEKIHNIESKIDNLNDLSKNMIDNCEYDINNPVVENKCSSFKKNYKNMVQSYYTMIDEYNIVLDTYNNYAEKNNAKKIDKYIYNLSFEINGIVYLLS